MAAEQFLQETDITVWKVKMVGVGVGWLSPESHSGRDCFGSGEGVPKLFRVIKAKLYLGRLPSPGCAVPGWPRLWGARRRGEPERQHKAQFDSGSQSGEEGGRMGDGNSHGELLLCPFSGVLSSGSLEWTFQ